MFKIYQINHTIIGEYMKKLTLYNIFLFLSNISRNIVEIFSFVYLYQKGYKIKNILLFYSIYYLVGVFISYITVYLTKYIRRKVLLIISGLLYGIAFYYLSVMRTTNYNLVILSIVLSTSSFIYHTIRHYYAMNLVDKVEDKKIASILISAYLPIIFSSILGSYIVDKYSILVSSIIVIILSIISIIPLIFIKDDITNNKIEYSKINNNKLVFFILEQFKVIFLLLEPIYLYLYVKKSLNYVGTFNILICISSIIYLYYIAHRININKYFKYINIIFCLVLLLKLNITNKYILLIVALLEGLGIKSFELTSNKNIYNIENNNINGYLITCELIFCFLRSIICLIFYLFIDNVKVMLYISLVPIFLISFVKLTDIKK